MQNPMPPQFVEAHANLDEVGNVMAGGATIAPDFVMRAVVAMRDRLSRHRPHDVDEHHYQYGTCVRDGERWPCVEVQGDLTVLGVTPIDELFD